MSNLFSKDNADLAVGVVVGAIAVCTPIGLMGAIACGFGAAFFWGDS